MGKILSISAVLLICSFCIIPVVADDRETEWGQEIGQLILSKIPPEVKFNSDLDKARFAYTIYTNALVKEDIPVNDEYLDRVKHLVFGSIRKIVGGLAPSLSLDDANRWTCSYHANILDGIFDGMGIKNSFMIETDKVQGTIPDMNSNHGAVAIAVGDQVYLFDPWMMAVKNGGTYAGGETSGWNGMESAEWERRMKKEGYSKFCDPVVKGDYDSVEPIVKNHISVGTQRATSEPGTLGGIAGTYSSSKRVNYTDSDFDNDLDLKLTLKIMPDHKAYGEYKEDHYTLIKSNINSDNPFAVVYLSN